MGPGKNTNALERISPSNATKNHNTTLEQKENDNFPETNPEITEIYTLNGREFKAVVRKKLAELQENSERHFNELWNKINKQKEYDTKGMEAHRAGSVSEWLRDYGGPFVSHAWRKLKKSQRGRDRLSWAGP